MPSSSGVVSLVGAGPGDPELLTLKAARRLGTAEVVLYDRLVSAEVLSLANASAEFIYTGKEEGHQEEMQAEIMRLLLDRARAGRQVVRLKGGDPFVFGRGGEEMRLLMERGIQVEVVPGVSSALAAPAAAGIPVTYRGVSASVAIVSARCKGGREADWARVVKVETLVILMGAKYRDRIARTLIGLGRPADEPCALIERATTPEQKSTITTLSEVAAGKVQASAPAVFVVGEVVSQAKACATAKAAEVRA